MINTEIIWNFARTRVPFLCHFTVVEPQKRTTILICSCNIFNWLQLLKFRLTIKKVVWVGEEEPDVKNAYFGSFNGRFQSLDHPYAFVKSYGSVWKLDLWEINLMSSTKSSTFFKKVWQFVYINKEKYRSENRALWDPTLSSPGFRNKSSGVWPSAIASVSFNRCWTTEENNRLNLLF